MLDPHHLRSIMDLRGIPNAAELARLAGIPTTQTVSRLLTGTTSPEKASWDTIARIARALRISIGDLDCSEPSRPHWESFSWVNAPAVEQLFHDLNTANSCLICTQGMEMYLEPPEVLRWTFRQAHQAFGWSNEKIEAALYTLKAVASPGDFAARHASHSVHRVIVRQSWFERALLHQPDSVLGFRSNLNELTGVTILGLVPPERWSELDARVLRAIRDCVGFYPRWDKIAVADTTFAVFRPSLDEFLVTFHCPTVDRIRAALEDVAKRCVTNDFPLGAFGLADLKASVRDAVVRLESVAREAKRKRKSSPEIVRALEMDNGFWAPLALGAKL